VASPVARTQGADDPREFYDSHFHLTNYVQQGITVQQFLQIMGTRVGRSTLFGIPLQQQWSYNNSGDFAPTYYLQSDAPLYYYSFTDAYIAMAYRALPPDRQARFDPMITGFNPADMYGAEHIKRVLQTFPGVFSGIGEFSIHKEFVSSKISGETASLTNPALDRILDFAAEAGLVVILHSDIDVPFSKVDAEPVYLTQMKALLKRHPGKNSIIWAHTGWGGSFSRCPTTPRHARGHSRRSVCSHVNFDLSWDEVANMRGLEPEATRRTANLLDREIPNRFLFGTDTVAPADTTAYLGVYHMYQPLWDLFAQGRQGESLPGELRTNLDEAKTQCRAGEGPTFQEIAFQVAS
jgi:hypothetical protein